MARPSYKMAIQWIAENDDTFFLESDDPISVTAAFVADLWNKTDQQVCTDIRKALKRETSRSLDASAKSV